MTSRSIQSRTAGLSLGFVLLAVLFAALWLTGGASRPTVLGQALSRIVIWTTLLVAILIVRRPSLNGLRPVLMLLTSIAIVPLVQLVPLPPSVWQTLPGRTVLVSATLAGEPLPWRPLSLSPGGTLNALFSLAAPLVVFVLLGSIRKTERAWLPALLVAVVLASTVIGLIQFSGSRFDQPLINYTGDVSGTFANRNHFALFLAMGCLPVPIWASRARGNTRWRTPAAVGLLVVLVLSVLASGSRTGMMLTALALIAGLLIARENLIHQLRGRLIWILPAAIGVFAGLVGLAVFLGRAVSIDRLFSTDVGQDMRVRAFDTLMSMTRTYFPAGSGLGSFDVVFRLHEPFSLLKPTYFNQAHDDYLAIVLDAGLLGLSVLVAATAWWMFASIRVWRWLSPSSPASEIVLGRLGSAMLGLTMAASIVDYPARTPLIMATTMLAACLLAWGTHAASDTCKTAPHA
jgi:hypothetical protein